MNVNEQRRSHLVQTGKAALRKACWKSGELSAEARGLCKLRLTLGFVRKSAVSGNSTGGRMRDDVEPVATGLWAGEATGLRLGDVPEEQHRFIRCKDKKKDIHHREAHLSSGAPRGRSE